MLGIPAWRVLKLALFQFFVYDDAVMLGIWCRKENEIFILFCYQIVEYTNPIRCNNNKIIEM